MRLNRGTVLFGVLIVAGFPTAIVATTAPATVKPTVVEEHRGIELASLDVPATVSLPEFVPVTSFDEFVLASREYVAITPSARRAAEALSEKFSLPSGDFGVPRPALQEDPQAPAVLSAADDPKALREAQKAAAAAAVQSVQRAERAAAYRPRTVQRRRVSAAEKAPSVKPMRSSTRVARLSGTTEDSMLGR